MSSKKLLLIDALCIVNTGWRTEQEKELLDNAYLVIKQHSEVLHLEYQRQCIDEKLNKIKGCRCGGIGRHVGLKIQ